MPDQNKIETLKGLGYCVGETCGQCKHARFVPGSNFGSCREYTYDHAKHGRRNLSVHVAGRCGKFEWNEKKLADLQRSGFEGFI